MILKQVRSTDGTGTLSYLLADETTKQALVIDPNSTDTDAILRLADELKVRIGLVIDTHTHADHVSAAGELKKLSGAKLLMHENTKHKWMIVDQGDKFGIGDILRANAGFEPDRFLGEEETLELGSMKLKSFFTPGHTDNHISLLAGDNLFTGDLLLIGQAGRSDLPGGNPGEQYDSLFRKILPLDDGTKIWPGHDYEGNSFSYLRDERRGNPFLKQRSKKEYLDFVAEYFPPVTDVGEGGKIILQCGTRRVTTSDDPFRSVDPPQLAELMEKEKGLFLLDVRQPFELAAFGKIPGVVNIPTREVPRRLSELPSDKSHLLVVVCQTGSRSYEIAHYLTKQGYVNVRNLEGGTGAWMEWRRRGGE